MDFCTTLHTCDLYIYFPINNSTNIQTHSFTALFYCCVFTLKTYKIFLLYNIFYKLNENYHIVLPLLAYI